jgi:hypothetical protein
MHRPTLLLLLVFASATAQAQLEEVVVTAQMRSGGYNEIPAVTIRRPADFLVQEIRLINDSRSPDLRRKEIISTIEGLLKRATSVGNVALSYGDGFLMPVDLSDESLQIIEDKKRTDTSIVDIFVKVTLGEKDSTKQRIADLRQFIARAQLVGRTEIEPQGDVGLSIVNPEKYRPVILGKIAEENARLVRTIGDKCQIKVAGLERRVQWERTDVAELTLYIPYGVEISHCVYGP